MSFGECTMGCPGAKPRSGNNPEHLRGSTCGLRSVVPTMDPARSTLPQPQAERRQLTVMFCDLVGSTQLSTRLDPEELLEVLGYYRSGVAAIVERFGGYVARFLGDGVVAFFGWPRGGEADAERAVRAGLAVIEAVGR